MRTNSSPKAEAALDEALRARDSEFQQRAISVANEQKALEAQEEAESARASEATLRHQAEAETYAADINLAQHALAANDLGRAKLLLAAYGSKEKEHLRGWEWRYLWQQCRSDASEQLHRYSHWVTAAAFSPSGEFLAVGGYRPPFVDLWDVRSRQRVVSLPGSLGETLAFSPGGEWLATSATGRGALIRVWQTGTTNLLLELEHPDMSQGQIRALKFSPDGTQLAGMSWWGEVALWGVESWTVIRRIPGVAIWPGSPTRPMAAGSLPAPWVMRPSRCGTWPPAANWLGFAERGTGFTTSSFHPTVNGWRAATGVPGNYTSGLQRG
jgi:hypothetical protein